MDHALLFTDRDARTALDAVQDVVAFSGCGLERRTVATLADFEATTYDRDSTLAVEYAAFTVGAHAFVLAPPARMNDVIVGKIAARLGRAVAVRVSGVRGRLVPSEPLAPSALDRASDAEARAFERRSREAFSEVSRAPIGPIEVLRIVRPVPRAPVEETPAPARSRSLATSTWIAVAVVAGLVALKIASLEGEPFVALVAVAALGLKLAWGQTQRPR